MSKETRTPKAESRSKLPQAWRLRTSDFPRLLRAWRLAIVCWLSAPALSPLAAHSPPSPSAPFVNLRQANLDYHGPDGDLTNLTEIRIGWFGPTNLADPLTGDLWFAANLAVRDANAQTSNFELRTSDFGLRTSNFELRTSPRSLSA